MSGASQCQASGVSAMQCEKACNDWSECEAFAWGDRGVTASAPRRECTLYASDTRFSSPRTIEYPASAWLCSDDGETSATPSQPTITASGLLNMANVAATAVSVLSTAINHWSNHTNHAGVVSVDLVTELNNAIHGSSEAVANLVDGEILAAATECKCEDMSPCQQKGDWTCSMRSVDSGTCPLDTIDCKKSAQIQPELVELLQTASNHGNTNAGQFLTQWTTTTRRRLRTSNLAWKAVPVQYPWKFADDNEPTRCHKKGDAATDVPCTECTAGRFATEGEGRCSLCPSGRFAGDPGMVTCSTCSAGRFAVVGSVTCDQCAAGRFSVDRGRGYERVGPGRCTGPNNGAAALCSIAAPIDQVSCVRTCNDVSLCQAYAWSGTGGLQQCSIYLSDSDCRVPSGLQASDWTVQEGEVGPVESTSGDNSAHPDLACFRKDAINMCTECAAGKYSLEGQSSCTKCEKGTSSVAASPVCRECERGSFADTEGHAGADCKSCLQGTFADRLGSTSCKNCPDSKYTNTVEPCQYCPFGKVFDGYDADGVRKMRLVCMQRQDKRGKP
jgi:hypothetical protein